MKNVERRLQFGRMTARQPNLVSSKVRRLLYGLVAAICLALVAVEAVALTHSARQPPGDALPVAAYAQKLAPLIDPAKLATLGKRGANPRVEKTVYWLSVASSHGALPEQVADIALKNDGMEGEAAALTEKGPPSKSRHRQQARLSQRRRPRRNETRQGRHGNEWAV